MWSGITLSFPSTDLHSTLCPVTMCRPECPRHATPPPLPLRGAYSSSQCASVQVDLRRVQSVFENSFCRWGGAVQLAARHGPRSYPKPWDGSLVFVKSVLPGVKSKTKEWGIKWEDLGGGLFVILSVYIHTPSVEMTLHGREKSPRLWSELVKARVCTRVCMHVCKLNMHTCLCVYLLQVCVYGAVWRDTERSDKCIYTIYYPGQHPENTPTVI